MKVRPTKIILLGTGEIPDHPNVTVGETYLVLFLVVHPMDGIKVAIIDNNQRSSMWLLAMFEIVDDRIPSNWVCRFEDGALQLAPASWLVERFWGQDYAARPITPEERQAMNADYKRELEIIRRESG